MTVWRLKEKVAILLVAALMAQFIPMIGMNGQQRGYAAGGWDNGELTLQYGGDGSDPFVPLSISWTAPENEAVWYYNALISEGPVQVWYKTSGETTREVYGLKADTSYSLRVEAYGQGDVYIGTLERTFRLDDLDGAPLSWQEYGDLAATFPNEGSVKLNWLPYEGAVDFYIVVIRDSGDQYIQDALVDSGIASPEAVMTGLTAGETYTAEIRAFDSGENVLDTLTGSFQLPGAPPDHDGLPPMWPQGATMTVDTVKADELSVSWPAASDKIAMYRLSLDGHETDTVPAAANAYSFTGLQSDKTYAISVVAVDEFGESSVPLSTSAATARESRLQWEAPEIGSGSKALKLGETMRITMQGVAGAGAEAAIQYESWYDDAGGSLLNEPMTKQAIVAMSEPAPGQYEGEWLLTESLGVARVVAIEGTLRSADNPAETVTLQESVDMPVTGRLEVEVQPGGGPIQSLIVQTSGVNGQSYGVLTVAASGVYTFPDQPPGDDYMIYVKERRSGRLLQTLGPIAVNGSLTHRETIEGVGMAALQVKVTDERGMPVQNASVTAMSEQLQKSASTNEDGIAEFGYSFVQGDTVTLAIQRTPPEYWPHDESVSVRLDAGLHTASLTLQTKTLTVVSGMVSDEQGKPAAGMTLTFNQQEPDRPDQYRTVRATSDEAGFYSVSLLRGQQALAEGKMLPGGGLAVPADIFMVQGDTLTHPMQARSNTVGSLDMNVFILTPGGAVEDIFQHDPKYKLLTFEMWDAAGVTRRVEEFPFTPYGNVGDKIMLCADGTRLNLSRSCQSFTLSQNDRMSFITLDSNQGGTVSASLAGAVGAYSDMIIGVDVLAYKPVEFIDDVPVTVLLDHPGTYVLKVYKGEFGNSAMTEKVFTVANGEAVNLGNISLPSDVSDDRDAALDTDRASVIVGESVQLRAIYRNKTGADQSGVKFSFTLPEGIHIAANSVLLNNRPIGAGQWEQAGRTATVAGPDPIGAGEAAQVKLTVKIPPDYSESLAVFEGEAFVASGSGKGRWQLGGQAVTVSAIRMYAPKRVSSLQTLVTGQAIAGSTVKVYADQVLLGQTTAPRSGYWSLPAQLPFISASHSYILSAVAEHEGQAHYAENREIGYNEEAPKPFSFSMQLISPRRGEITPYNPGHGIFILDIGLLVYRVKFDDPDSVSNVRFHVGPTELAALPDENGEYMATMWLGGKSNEQRKAVHPVYVEYDSAPPPYKGGTRPVTEAQIREHLPYWWKQLSLPSASALKTEQRGDTEKWGLRLETPEFGEAASITANLSVEKNVNYDPQGKPRLESDGVTMYDPEVVIRRNAGSGTPFSDAPAGYHDSRAKLLAWAGSGGKDVSATIRITGYVPYDGNAMETAAAKGRVRTAALNTQIAKSTYEIVLDGTDLGLNMLGSQSFRDTLDDLQALIDECYDTCDMGKAVQRHREIENIMENAMLAEVGKWMMAGTGFVAGALGPPGWVLSTLVFVNSQLFGAVLDNEVARQIKRVMHRMKDDCKFDEEEFKRKQRQRKDHRQRGELAADPRYIYDPSGYVYEVVPEERVQGATATALMWHAEEELWQEWNAEEYLQKNPLVTDAEGKYGWDVPEGKWKVRYEKEGYVTVYSEELTVLPPHYDVNIPLVSTDPPELTAVRSEDGGQSVQLQFSRYMEADSLNGDTVQVKLPNGTVAEGAMQFPDAVIYDGKQVAKQVLFVPAQPLAVGDVVEVTVSHLARGYNGLPLEGETTWSATVAASDETAPAAVTGLMLIPDADRLYVYWKDGDDTDLDHLVLRWKRKGNGEAANVVVDKGAGSHTLEGLMSRTEYEVEVIAYDVAGNASPSASAVETTLLRTVMTDRTPPGAVIGARISTETTSLAIDWEDPDDPDLAYVALQWYESGVAEPLGQRVIEAGRGKAMITGLSPSSAYEVELAAFDKSGNASRYVELTGRTLSESTNGGGIPWIPGTDSGEGDANEPFSVNWRDLNNEGLALFGGELALRLNKEGASNEIDGRFTIARSEEEEAAGDPLLARAGAIYSFTLEKEGGRWLPLQAEIQLGTEPLEKLRKGNWADYQLGLYRKAEGSEQWTYAGGRWDDAEERMSVTMMEPGMYAVMVYSPSFVDMKGHWGQKYAEALAARHLADGVGAGRFAPQRDVTRAELAAFLIRWMEWELEEPLDAGAGALAVYRDVEAGAWYTAVLQKAASSGLLQGSGGRMRPGDPVTREEAAVMALRAWVYVDGKESATRGDEDRSSAGRFTDADAISDWAQDAVGQLHSLGVLGGHPDGSFNPRGSLTRAQSAAVVEKLLIQFRK
ncbi:S-layer homology domain-containing protein [Paenibacillus sp. J5C_2022]|uniref:fibronectin type III domain-containing protein n=1 Tax=Paenibacillus sp. J5C2022 TaxID=2977129 RepID=UPI0021CF6579|nr:fibronectin type III domain-containing protein [Paenibacillus sp. J5C2022]MCU6710222.1 S-layer homology domain-containing protein [Paenibacillus sp. J5C2022]